ncbi:hypothetical protein FP2506_00235 [Fulvimarina pelagi HTCC2506]|uniref:Cation efflux protein cytoplasmic domain-containing protein n=1 Tax=Fulvimarina pelagi HTCC2506 TaxID=314231 RepID=Q0FXT8_9HYPH|nr:hypothetical protein FP2506_00235 [Fulvimarina pelagi HTCC2506]
MTLAADAVPPGIDQTAVRRHLEAPNCVEEVHDLHISGISTTETALTAHLVCADRDRADELLARVPRELHDGFGIEHATLQMESESIAASCGLRSRRAV